VPIEGFGQRQIATVGPHSCAGVSPPDLLTSGAGLLR
jgi:hypothetical protein